MRSERLVRHSSQASALRDVCYARGLRTAQCLALQAMQALPALVPVMPYVTPASIGLAGCVWVALIAGAFAAAFAGIALLP